MATVGTSTHPPINLHRLGWSSSLWEQEGSGRLRREHNTQASLPDLLHFLSDGFGQREGPGLNLFDGHSATVTGEWKELALVFGVGAVCGRAQVGSYCIPVQVKTLLRLPACPVQELSAVTQLVLLSLFPTGALMMLPMVTRAS